MDGDNAGVDIHVRTLATTLADAATDALRAEVDLTPKPGLVDARGSGSHHDMSHALMRASADALHLGFHDAAVAATHDGTSLRPSLPDAIDQVSDEAVLNGSHRDERSLCNFLFGSGRFRGDQEGFYHPSNADLLWIIMNRKGNPIGLAVLAMLVAHRLNLSIGGCNFPAHFLAWISVEGDPHLVDCFGRGRLIAVEEIRRNSAVLTPDSRRAIEGPCTMRDILLRILRNLHLAFTQQDRGKDADLIGELLLSLQSEP